MGKLNHHAIYNGDLKIPTSEFPVESNSELVPDPDTTPIKSDIIQGYYMEKELCMTRLIESSPQLNLV